MIEPRTRDTNAPVAFARGQRTPITNNADMGPTKCVMALAVTKYKPKVEREIK